MELKFDPKCKWSVFRAKYQKSEIEFEDHYLLCVCCAFATFPSFWRPFGAIFCLTVDATSCQSKASTRQDIASTVKQNIAPNGLQQFGKAVRHSKHTTGKVFQTLFWFLGIFHGKLPIIFN